ncbi:hypothetical protein LCGC14_0938290 [marine sediment metagenome]|uniref:Uncharacterized protein n=1 Tax=marine sediment metagenome TaxID=412755 RepID=A0A0F9NKW5_9ZZZZ
MKLKPTRIKVSAKEQEKSIRIEINALDKKDGRKVFSFNLYETDLEAVMRVLVMTFETITKEIFPEDIKRELLMDPGMLIVQRQRGAGKKIAMVASVKHTIMEGGKVGIPGVKEPDGWLSILSSLKVEIIAEPMTVNDKVKGYVFYRKKD